MDDASALLDAIVHDPDDDLPRLAYADWCEENGLDARAEFIRVQLELGRAGCAGERRKALVRREKSLLAGNERRWAKPFKPRLTKLGYRRGFVERATVKAPSFLDAPHEVMTCAPLRVLTLLEAGPRAGELARCEMLAWLTGVGLPGAGAGPIAAVLESPHLDRLESLDLSRNGLGAGCLGRLPAAPFARLKALFLDGNDLDRQATPDWIVGAAPALEVLSLVGTPLNHAGLHHVAANLPALRAVYSGPTVQPFQTRLREAFPHIRWHFGRRPERDG